MDPVLLARIDDHERIIAFRNRLIHGYDGLDPARIWTIVHQEVPPLAVALGNLM